MSRKNDQTVKLEAGVVTGENGDFDGNPERTQVVVVDVEKDENNQSEEEKRELLSVENNASPLGLHGISATCQSVPAGKAKLGLELTAAGEKGDPDQSIEHFNARIYFDYSRMERRSSVRNALLTLFFALFNLFWSVGLTYWHFQLNNFAVAVTSLAIIAVSGSITSIAFFTGQTRRRHKSFSGISSRSPNRATSEHPSARSELWRCCKVAWLLAAIPCLVPVILACAYFISSLVEKRAQWSCSSSRNGGSGSGSTTVIASSPTSGGNEQRQYAKSNSTTTSSTRWLAASGRFFLLESLTLCFPFCVLQLSLLMENSNSIPSVIGLYTLFGLFILSLSITFSRFQFDCLNKPDRFGERTEMYLRFTYLWSAKIIWLVTFAILIVTVRLLYPGREIEATAGAVAGLTAIHEIPLWICLLPPCGKLAAKLSGLFFLIPQFTSLISLIYWVNTDPLIYQTNIGSIVLGVYFWSEAVMLCGWLVDGNADKDVDLVPLYPHFFGDLISSCVPDQTSP